jgi:hypothetical protein
MASKVAERMRLCEGCGNTTLQRKNTTEMRWILHLFFAVITGGVWFIIWLLIFALHILNKSATAIMSNWICSSCGAKN